MRLRADLTEKLDSKPKQYKRLLVEEWSHVLFEAENSRARWTMEARLSTAKQVSEIVGFKRTKLMAMTKVNEWVLAIAYSWHQSRLHIWLDGIRLCDDIQGHRDG